ncbi:MAG: DNA repair protein RecN [Rikenellaceae bacterium]
MLKSLIVENYALIDRLEISLDPALNIITGETGAGKSILLGALGLLMGGKNDGTATKDNTKSCVVEGTFSIGMLNLEPLFEANDWEYEEVITLRRVITASGKSRSFIGDIPVSLSELKILSERLIDIHSQHQNQILSNEEFRISAIDLLYDSKSLLAKYLGEYNTLQSLRAKLRTAEEVAASARRDEEWITHQVEELTAANLRIGESEEAEAELKILENSELITQNFEAFTARMEQDDEGGILVALRASQKEMQQIAKSFPDAADYAERLGSVVAELKDMYSSISASSESIEADPERLSKLSSRIDTIYSLCQKHRAADLAELIEIRDRYAAQLGAILGSDEEITRLKKEIKECEGSTSKLSAKITESRRKVAPIFEKSICKTLKQLGMEQARFTVQIRESKATPLGSDAIDFLFSSVEGKSPQPVERIASGGEISRVMLALKVLLAEKMSLPTIIFDEIDTGVSGRIADAMGEIIEELSRKMQVIDITHLPQVASKGNSHFVVYKEGGRTNITRLSKEERVQQIATMLSGSVITDAAVEQAQFLLGGHCKAAKF